MFQSSRVQIFSLGSCQVFLYPFKESERLDEKAKKDLPKRSFGPIRELEWHIGRNLLSLKSSQLGVDLGPEKIELLDFCRIKDVPGFFSLSHTRGLCVLAWSPSEPVGIDVEKAGRKVPERSMDKFIADSDQFDFADPLKKWCVKEACFKSLAAWTSEKAAPKSLKEVVIKQGNFFYHKLMGTYSFIDIQGHVAVLARAKA